MSREKFIASVRADVAVALDAVAEVFGVAQASIRRASHSHRRGSARRMDGTRVLWRFHGAGAYVHVQRARPVDFDFTPKDGIYCTAFGRIRSARRAREACPPDALGLWENFEVAIKPKPLATIALVARYVNAQKRVLRWLGSYAVPPDVTEMQWICDHRERVRSLRLGATDGIRFFPHGAGLAYSDEVLTIDFDFPIEGQGPRFNADRLYQFAARNEIECEAVDLDAIQGAIDGMSSRGIFGESGCGDYFVVAERVRRSSRATGPRAT